MSAGVYRKQYQALAGLATDSGIEFDTPEGSFNQKFCELCRIIIDSLGGTFEPVKASFHWRKSAYLWQIAKAMGGSPDASAGKTILVSAKAIYDASGSTEAITGTSFNYRVYEYLYHATLSVPLASKSVQTLQGGIVDGTLNELTDTVNPLNYTEPTRERTILSDNSVGLRENTFEKIGDEWFCYTDYVLSTNPNYPNSFDSTIHTYKTSADVADWTLGSFEYVGETVPKGALGSFDFGGTATPASINISGVIHLFYSGRSTTDGNAVRQIGLATSEDGVNFTKQGEITSGLDWLDDPCVIVNGTTLYLYHTVVNDTHRRVYLSTYSIDDISLSGRTDVGLVYDSGSNYIISDAILLDGKVVIVDSGLTTAESSDFESFTARDSILPREPISFGAHFKFISEGGTIVAGSWNDSSYANAYYGLYDQAQLISYLNNVPVFARAEYVASNVVSINSADSAYVTHSAVLHNNGLFKVSVNFISSHGTLAATDQAILYFHGDNNGVGGGVIEFKVRGGVYKGLFLRVRNATNTGNIDLLPSVDLSDKIADGESHTLTAEYDGSYMILYFDDAEVGRREESSITTASVRTADYVGRLYTTYFGSISWLCNGVAVLIGDSVGLNAGYAEGAGSIVHDGAGNGSITNANWVASNSAYPINITNPFTLYKHATLKDLRIGYIEGEPNPAPVIPSGYYVFSENPAGFTHNGAESLIIQTDLVNGDLLARTTLSANGTSFDAHSYDYFLNHYNTQNWFDAIGIKLGSDGISLQVCDVKDLYWFYNEMTPEQFARLTNWSGGTSVEILYDLDGEVVTDSNGETIFTLPEA